MSIKFSIGKTQVIISDCAKIESIPALGLNTAIKTYRVNPALNYSLIKKTWDNPLAIRDGYFEDNAGMYLGSAVDAIVFDTFDQDYVRGIKIAPSDNIRDTLYYAFTKNPENLTDDNILEGAKEVNYGQTWNPETVIAKVRKNGQKTGNQGEQYFAFLKEAKGKKVIADEDYNQANNIAKIVKEKESLLLERCEYQQPYSVTVTFIHPDESVELFKLKALFDMIDVDHAQAFDLKVIGQDLRWFEYNYYIKYKYYLQEIMYWLVMVGITENVNSTFAFKVYNKDYPNYPNTFTGLSNIEKTLHGFTYQGRDYPGLLECLRVTSIQKETGYDAPIEVINKTNQLIELSL